MSRIVNVDSLVRRVSGALPLFSGGAVVQPYTSAEISLKATSTGNVIAPAVPGKRFCPVRLQVLQTATVSTLTTAATIAVRCGGTFLAATTLLTNGTAFAFGAGGLTQSSPTQAASGLNTACVVDVTIAATGGAGFVYLIKVIATGFYL